MDDSLYKNDIEEPFSQEIKHQFIENDREFDGEEEEIDTTIPAREELFEIIERINNFDGETMTDDTMNAISNLALSGKYNEASRKLFDAKYSFDVSLPLFETILDIR